MAANSTQPIEVPGHTHAAQCAEPGAARGAVANNSKPTDRQATMTSQTCGLWLKYGATAELQEAIQSHGLVGLAVNGSHAEQVAESLAAICPGQVPVNAAAILPVLNEALRGALVEGRLLAFYGRVFGKAKQEVVRAGTGARACPFGATLASARGFPSPYIADPPESGTLLCVPTERGEVTVASRPRALLFATGFLTSTGEPVFCELVSMPPYSTPRHATAQYVLVGFLTSSSLVDRSHPMIDGRHTGKPRSSVRDRLEILPVEHQPLPAQTVRRLADLVWQPGCDVAPPSDTLPPVLFSALRAALPPFMSTWNMCMVLSGLRQGVAWVRQRMFYDRAMAVPGWLHKARAVVMLVPVPIGAFHMGAELPLQPSMATSVVGAFALDYAHQYTLIDVLDQYAAWSAARCVGMVHTPWLLEGLQFQGGASHPVPEPSLSVMTHSPPQASVGLYSPLQHGGPVVGHMAPPGMASQGMPAPTVMPSPMVNPGAMQGMMHGGLAPPPPAPQAMAPMAALPIPGAQPEMYEMPKLWSEPEPWQTSGATSTAGLGAAGRHGLHSSDLSAASDPHMHASMATTSWAFPKDAVGVVDFFASM